VLILAQPDFMPMVQSVLVALALAANAQVMSIALNALIVI